MHKIPILSPTLRTPRRIINKRTRKFTHIEIYTESLSVKSLYCFSTRLNPMAKLRTIQNSTLLWNTYLNSFSIYSSNNQKFWVLIISKGGNTIKIFYPFTNIPAYWPMPCSAG